MTRLTEVLCSYQKPIKKFNNYRYVSLDKNLRPKTLKDHVSNKGAVGKRSVCVEPMSDMLDCFKKHEFNEEPCTSEIKKFYKCWNDFQKLKADKEEADKKGIVLGGRLSNKQVNNLLKQFPHPTT